MMPMIRDLMLAISSSLAGSIVFKVTLVSALGLIAARLARGNRAAVRHALLTATLGVALLLPIAAAFMPPVRIGVPAAVLSRAPILPLMMAVDATPSPATVGAGARMTDGVQPRGLRWQDLLFAAWGAGAALFLLPVVFGLWQIRSLRRAGLPWRRGQAVAEALAQDAGIHRRVEVLLHEALPGPMTCGSVRPVIILPREAESWNQEDLSRAIIHELEHVRRADSVTRCFARATCAVYWFHPLVWAAWRTVVLEAERSCDDAVLRRSEATAYANQLVELAKRLSASQRPPIVAMANRADLATRVGAVLDNRERRGRAGIFCVSAVCASALALIIGLSPLVVLAEPQSQPMHFEAASLKQVPDGEAGFLSILPRVTGDRFTWTAPLGELVMYAYHLPTWRFSGIDTSAPIFYRVTASMDPNSSEDQARLMLQTLLIERFKIVSHYETRALQGYGLVVAKNGPKLQTVSASGEPPPMPDYRKDSPPAAFEGRIIPEVRAPGVSAIMGRGVPLSRLAEQLSQELGEFVLDQTGLSGKYYFGFQFASIAHPNENAEAPTIFSAVQNELGLRLEKQKAPVQFLVVDRYEKKPADN